MRFARPPPARLVSRIRSTNGLTTPCKRYTTKPDPDVAHYLAPSNDVLGFLERRGLVKDIAGDRKILRTKLSQSWTSSYSGIDPTASSLHLGHLLPLNVLFWLHTFGHRSVSLLGDATVRIGDPTDRLHARKELERSQRVDNITRMRQQLHQLWDNKEHMQQKRAHPGQSPRDAPSSTSTARRTIDANNRWLSQLSITEYLATVGQCGKLGAMLSRDTVKLRLEKGESMSLAEFNYPMIQAYDWWHMFRESGVELQIGGSDQYGNIVAGMDLIDFMTRNGHESSTTQGKRPFGITTPLLTSSAGEKFGKSAGNAVWLDATLTKPFELYGYLLRTADVDVQRFLKLLTLVPDEAITTTMTAHHCDPSKRAAQHLLALEICRLAHGEDWASRTAAEHARSRLLTLENVEAGEAGQKIALPRTLFELSSIGQLLVYAALAESATRGNALRQGGGLYRATKTASNTGSLAFEPVPKARARLEDNSNLLVDRRYLVLRSGKWNMSTLEVLDDDDFDRKGLTVAGLDDWRERAALLRKNIEAQRPSQIDV